MVVYVPIGNEIDPALIVQTALGAGKLVYYPVRMGPPEFRTTKVNTVVANPDPAALPRDAQRVLFVVPGVAFDARGARLGRGAGWYDRGLSTYLGADRLGLSYAFQIVPRLPEAPWDIRMHTIVTDTCVIRPPEIVGSCKETSR